MKFKKLPLPENLLLTKDSSRCTLKEFLRQIDFNKSKLKKIQALLSGTFQSSHMGPGFDFNEIREYKIGDDLRHISWNTTAKTGNLHTKEYFSEKEMLSYFLIDISNSMFCGLKVDIFMQLVAFLLYLASTFSEQIGGVFFSSDVRYHFPLLLASSQANIIFQSLLNFVQEQDNDLFFTSCDRTDLPKALDFMRQSFSRKGIVFLVSDFINLVNWEKSVYELSQKQNIFSFQIFDSVDFKLPNAGYVSIIDPETNKRFFVNTDNKAVQEKYLKLTHEKQEKLKKFFRTIGANHYIIEREDFN